MSWVRLYITVEGQAEKEFADRALKPHLAAMKAQPQRPANGLSATSRPMSGAKCAWALPPPPPLA